MKFKSRYIWLIFYIAGALFFVALWNNYIKVDVAALAKVDGDEEIFMKKSFEMSAVPVSYDDIIVLNREQKDMFKALLENTKFERIVSKTVRFNDRDRYIVAKNTFENGFEFRFEIYGGEFLIFDYRQDNKTMHAGARIDNENWKEELEKIISLSDENIINILELKNELQSYLEEKDSFDPFSEILSLLDNITIGEVLGEKAVRFSLDEFDSKENSVGNMKEIYGVSIDGTKIFFKDNKNSWTCLSYSI